jgi:hypothetical protein
MGKIVLLGVAAVMRCYNSSTACLWEAWRTLSSLCMGPLFDAKWRGSAWGGIPRHLALQHAQGWLQFVPNEWLAEGWSAPPQPHLPCRAYHDATHTLLERLGWKVPNDDIGPEAKVVVPIASLSVRLAYRMLLQPVVDCRVEQWKVFIAEAHGIDVATVNGGHVHVLRSLLAVIWRRIKWSNNRKVLYCQICVNGLPTSTSRNTGQACYCAAVALPVPGQVKCMLCVCHVG